MVLLVGLLFLLAIFWFFWTTAGKPSVTHVNVKIERKLYFQVMTYDRDEEVPETYPEHLSQQRIESALWTYLKDQSQKREVERKEWRESEEGQQFFKEYRAKKEFDASVVALAQAAREDAAREQAARERLSDDDVPF